MRCRLGPFVSGSAILALVTATTLDADLPAAAQVERSAPTAPARAPVEWRFDEPQPDWKPTLAPPGMDGARLERTADALRVILPEGSRTSRRQLVGGIYVDLPDWRREEWAEVIVRARSAGSIAEMRAGLNLPDDAVPAGAAQRSSFGVFAGSFQSIFLGAGRGNFTPGGVTPIIRDGVIRSYRMQLDWGSQTTGPLRRIGFQFHAATHPGGIDLLSVRVVPPAAPPRLIETVLQPSQLKSDFTLFRTALEEAHPHLYRYTRKAALDAAFARAERQLTRPMTILQFRNVLARVVAAIKDGHTGFTSYQGDEVTAVVDSAKQFPLALTFDGRRAFVLLNQGGDARVKPGMEVLAINGTSVADILQRILPNLASDGDVRTWQTYQLGMRADDIRSRSFFQIGRNGRTGFAEAYRLFVADPPSFRIALRDLQTRTTTVLDLPGVLAAEAAANAEKNPVNRDVLAGLRTLRIGIGGGGQAPIRFLDEDTAVLANPWGAGFQDVLEKTFAELRSRGTKHLIIDVRGNTGGSDQAPGLLFSYLTARPFRGVEGNRVKTYAPSFLPYTGLADVDPVLDPYFGPAAGFWNADPRGGWVMTDKYPAIGVRAPSEPHFGGPVYVLIDGGSFSASSQFTTLVDHHKRATFIGEETGGIGSGGAGSDIGPTLPESHLHVRISIESYFSVVDKSPRRRGTLPRYRVVQTVDDLEKGRDTVLEFTRELIRRGGQHEKAPPLGRAANKYR